MYCPGNVPGKMVNAAVYGADGLVLDLEDAVGEGEKSEARILVAEALRSCSFSPCAVAVRVNAVGTPWWRSDMEEMVRAGARRVRLPKVEQAAAVAEAAELLDELEAQCGIDRGSVRLQIILETPAGVEEAFRIAAASARVEALSFGAEDYCAQTGIRRTGPDYALDYPRARIVCAAAGNGIACYDTVWADFADAEGLLRDAERARALGFDGKSLIHPDQIEVVNRVFSFTESELAWAKRVIAAAGDGGATAVDGGMVDAPVVRRAHRILAAGGGNG